MKFLKSFIWLAFVFATTASFAFSQDAISIPVTEFNPEQLEEYVENPKWSILSLPRRDKTTYTLVEMNDRTAIKGESKNSASGLIYKVDIDPNEYPIIEWSWKVDDVLEQGNYKTKDGDDYAARIYITFDYSKRKLKFGDRVKYEAIRTFTRYKIPLRALNYVWANKAETETIAPNAYTNWVYMVAVQSGKNESGDWKFESRNIVEDYKAAFGEEPPRISGVAIMTDSDNTKAESKGYYGDIVFRSLPLNDN
ncbi:MAG: DUF3047 domain-containing protein [Balneola sp.]|nr:MAG: DUF3047 domain-containing protein [Balneola sp.]